MFVDLMYEMLKRDVSLRTLSNALGISDEEMLGKLKDNPPITCAEAVKIKQIVNPDLTLDVLFKVSE